MNSTMEPGGGGDRGVEQARNSLNFKQERGDSNVHNYLAKHTKGKERPGFHFTKLKRYFLHLKCHFFGI